MDIITGICTNVSSLSIHKIVRLHTCYYIGAIPDGVHPSSVVMSVVFAKEFLMSPSRASWYWMVEEEAQS